MNNPFNILMQSSMISQSHFPANSRYHTTPAVTMITEDGREVPYLKRRIVPPSGRFSLLQEHVVTRGERLDTIAARYLNDPELFWQLCDANDAIRPESLIEMVGNRIRITLPAGIQNSSE